MPRRRGGANLVAVPHPGCGHPREGAHRILAGGQGLAEDLAVGRHLAGEALGRGLQVIARHPQFLGDRGPQALEQVAQGQVLGLAEPGVERATSLARLAQREEDALHGKHGVVDRRQVVAGHRLALLVHRGDEFLDQPPLAALGLSADSAFNFSIYAFDNYFTGNLTDAIEGMTFTLAKPRFATPPSSTLTVPAGGSTALTIQAVAGGATASPSQRGLLLMYRDGAPGKESEHVGVSP